MTNWILKTLGDVLGPNGYIRGPFGSSLKRSEMKASGIPVYEQQHAIYNRRDFRFFVDNVKLNELLRFQVKANDLIISCSGTVGKISIINDNDPKGIISQALLILRPETNQVSPAYLKYFLTSELGQYHLLSASHGSVQPNIAERKIVQQIPISLPNVDEQDEITEVLSSLDDKIDLLHRNNKTLEQLAETLFRQWFVEEAKEDWEEKRLGDIVRTVLGGTPSTTIPEYWDGNIPWINSGEVNKSRIVTPTRLITNEGLVNSNTKLLPKKSTVIAITGATMGQVSYLEINTCANQSVVGLIPNETYFGEFVHLLVKHCVSDMIQNETGGAQPHINKNDVNSTVVRVPSANKLSQHKLQFEGIYNKVTTNCLQIIQLENLRDTLLPKLMSGEVRVKN